MKTAPPRLQVLDAMRGIAALAVCWYHFTSVRDGFLPDGFARSSEPLGRMGVQMFFVISGFIIPFTLQRSRYRVSDYGTFLLKRIVRLDPPYLAAILCTIAIGYASAAAPGYRGPPFTASIAQVALHLGYLNVLTHRPWLNPVFWTLGVEVQYYLFVGLVFPLVASRSAPVRALAFAAMASAAFYATEERFLFHWLFLFMLGMAAFQFRAGILGRAAFALWVVALGVGAGCAQGLEVAAVGVASCVVLGVLEFNVRRPLLFFGRISYSLYLVHDPVGQRVINLGIRFVHSIPGKLGILAASLAVSISAAWLLYVLVERPAMGWASRIRYRERRLTGPDPAESQGTPSSPAAG